MARKPRQDIEGIHHVYARGNNRNPIFADDVDRESYLATLRFVVRRMRWGCLAYCLMDNHVHLLLETREANLGRGMQRLHGLHGRAFNDRHKRSGHVFQGRYGSTLQTTDEQLWHTIAYVVRNPVEAGLCDQPQHWPWSSHAAMLRDALPTWMDPSRLLRCFEGIGGDPRERYAQLTA
jgi:REP element-mobilizing transposase RayT